MSDLTETLKKGAEFFGVELTRSMTERLFEYKELLAEGNEKMNLTAIKDDEGVVVKHFIDSFSVAPLLAGKRGFRLIDVGSGAGLPGIVLSVIFPEAEIIMLDSTAKRVNFINETAAKMRLDNARGISARAEEAGRLPEHREKFDYCVVRAVAALPILAELCLPFVKVGGGFIAMKGENADGEIREGTFAVKTLGGEIAERRKIVLPFGDYGRTILYIKKIRQTPPKYSRKFAQISKSPLINAK